MIYLITSILLILPVILYFVIPEFIILWGIIFASGLVLIITRVVQKIIQLMFGSKNSDNQDYDSCINYSDGNF